MTTFIDPFENSGEFTTQMLDTIWEIEPPDDDYYCDAIEFLNKAERFRSFSDGLTLFIKSHGYQDDENDVSKKTDFLFNKLKSNNIKISKSTIKDWFSEKRRPDYKSRENIFKICFGLELTPEETDKFFYDIYFDRSFNYRNIKELVYFYCLNTHKNYQHANQLIDYINNLLDTSDKLDEDSTIMTQFINTQSRNFSNDNELIQFVIKHQHNFKKNNVRGRKIFNELLDKVKGKSEDKKNIDRDLSSCGLVVQESMINKLEIAKLDIASIDFMFFVINNIDFVKYEKEHKDFSFIKNANLHKIILTNYPTKHTFSDIIKDSKYSYEALRKAIILLQFYSFWFEAHLNSYDLDYSSLFDAFVEETNDSLEDAGLGLLYPGNPFDWLFLYCSTIDSEDCLGPLNAFRSIISSVSEI